MQRLMTHGEISFVDSSICYPAQKKSTYEGYLTQQKHDVHRFQQLISLSAI